jgi:hypothetical protein
MESYSFREVVEMRPYKYLLDTLPGKLNPVFFAYRLLLSKIRPLYFFFAKVLFYANGLDTYGIVDQAELKKVRHHTQRTG